ncbi:MAG: metallopeptidase family protein [Minisyncoccia bacterium]|jgi:predicted Zn-dependent protease with MMP-like domain
MTRKKFEKLVSEAIKTLPISILKKLKNVAIVIEDLPSEYQLKNLGYYSKNSLLGLYEGTPQIQRGNYNRVMPDKISLFQKNIEAISKNDCETIRMVIRDTLWHEIGHHFGMTEEEVQRFINTKFHQNI